MTAKKNILKIESIIAMIFPGLRPASMHAQRGDGLQRRHRGYLPSSLQLRLHDEVVLLGTIVFNRVEQTFADTV